MSKQDRQGARTLAELMSRYNFGKTFADIMGIATDAQKSAEKAVDAVGTLDGSLNHDEIFNRLTKNGTLQGLYRGDDGELYVNATYVKSGKISSDLIDGSTLTITKGATIAGWDIDQNSIFKKPDGGTWGTGTFMCTGSNSAYSIGGSDAISGWAFGAGGKFGVTKDGALYCDDAHLKGAVTATSGKIGNWNVGEVTITEGTTTHYTGFALYTDAFYEGSVETAVYLTPTAVYVKRRQSTGDDVRKATWVEIVVAVNNAS